MNDYFVVSPEHRCSYLAYDFVTRGWYVYISITLFNCALTFKIIGRPILVLFNPFNLFSLNLSFPKLVIDKKDT